MFFGDRKTGCRFYEFTFLGYRSLLIENNCIRTVMLLDKGTDIISFIDKKTDTEFVWTNPMGISCLSKIKKANFDADCYSDNYVGGWFEILPNMGGECSFAGKHFVGHSEVSYLPWDFSVLKDSEEEIKLLFITRLSKYPFEIRKTLTLKQNEPTLYFKEEVTNLGNTPLEYMWAQHPNVGKPFLNEDCVIEFPFLADVIPMPAVGSGVGTLETYENIPDNFAVIKNKKTGLGLRFEWDKSVFKHCKLWLNGGDDCGHHHHGGTYVACILPCSSKIMDLDKSALEKDTLICGAKEKRESYFNISVINSD